VKQKIERSCAGCRLKDDKTKFVRIVAAPGGELAVDVDYKAEGRSLYLCPKFSCIKAVLKKGRLFKLLRMSPFSLTAEELFGMINEAYKKKLFSLLNLCRKGKNLALGRQLVEAKIRDKKAYVVLIAKDAAFRTKKAFYNMKKEVKIVEWGKKDEYGAALGVRPVAVIAVTQNGLAFKINNLIEKLLELEGSQ